MKGNVIDLAVGVVIGAAFGKIVASLVGDMIMPPLGLVDRQRQLQRPGGAIGTDPTGKAVLLKYGVFIQTVFEFLIIALAHLHRHQGHQPAEAPAAAAPPAGRHRPTEALLQDIEDQLARR